MKRLKLTVLLLLAILSCSATFLENENSIPVFLHYSNGTHVDGIRRPHKVPANIHLSLNVFYNANDCQLVFADPEGKNYYYTIVDNNDNIVSGGYLDFNEQTNINISLGSQTTGNYTLIVWYGEYEFSGSF